MLTWQHFFQKALGQKFQFSHKKPFSLLKRIYIGLFGSNSKSAPQNWPLWQILAPLDKRWGNSNFDLEWYQKRLDDVILTAWWWRQQNFYEYLRDFVPEYQHANFGCNWTTNREKHKGALCPPMCPQPLWFQKTPAWIGLTLRTGKLQQLFSFLWFVTVSV